MKSHHTLLLLGSLFFAASCSQKSSIINKEEVAQQLQAMKLSVARSQQKLQAGISFWQQRLENNANDYVAQLQLASHMVERYHLLGNIQDLSSAEKLYQQALPMASLNSSGVYRSLAQLYITQHRFRMAEEMLNKAWQMGDEKYATTMQLFDVKMELGKYDEAKRLLKPFLLKDDFNILIRKAKWEDQVNGDLDAAIVFMEQALAKNKDTTTARWQWLNSNLGDMYTHAGMPEKAKQFYTKVLQQYPDDLHCLKGLAWLAFAHDGDTQSAENIIASLQKVHQVPDYYLLKADIATINGQDDEAAHQQNMFMQTVADSQFYYMYAKYQVENLLSAQHTSEAAATIVNAEMKERPTPEVQARLANWHAHLGNSEKALQIIQNNVEGKCFEPDVLLQMAFVYEKNNMTAKAKEYYTMVLDAALETGPVVQRQVEEKLALL